MTILLNITCLPADLGSFIPSLLQIPEYDAWFVINTTFLPADPGSLMPSLQQYVASAAIRLNM